MFDWIYHPLKHVIKRAFRDAFVEIHEEARLQVEQVEVVDQVFPPLLLEDKTKKRTGSR